MQIDKKRILKIVKELTSGGRLYHTENGVVVAG